MDKDIRNAIERATQRARRLLEDDFAAQLEGTFDVLRTGTIAPKAGSHLFPRQVFQRDKIVAAIEHKRAAGMSGTEAVGDYLRDAAFTALNRFVALKMLEARGLVQECVTKGEQSAGYREFCGLAPGVALLPDSTGYRLYIECLFDELSTEVKVLFDRRDPASVLWPKRAAFEALLEVLNSGELTSVWGEDETIGWVYQFFNSGDERKKMRVESQAPRNSRELAVRNQFFTPRYVVEFLTDNTLGRIWFEMRAGETALVDHCGYLVRRPGETYVLRAKKDPRDLRVLDPACGSGHFLLYAFDLLIPIYEEAYRDATSPKSEATGRTLAADYPSLDALQRALPALILAHNLHGVDIDPRCAQIAQLALWMRAQRAFHNLEVGRAERPLIRKSNIVVAEPLVSDDLTLKEFLAKLGDAELARVFLNLVETLKLAGDLGLLLRVEELVARAPGRGQTGDLFTPPEARIRAALTRFVVGSSLAASTERRLFAEDAAQGVGLLEIAEKKFDVVLMNPPFGESTTATRAVLKSAYGQSGNDLFAAFVSRGLQLRTVGGLLGAITSRTGFYVSSLDEWRAAAYRDGLFLVADLGERVMDAAIVESAAYCIGAPGSFTVFRLLSEAHKQKSLQEAIQRVLCGEAHPRVYRPTLDTIRSIPNAPLAYWLSDAIIQKLTRWTPFEPVKKPGSGAVRKGLRTGDNFRFVRAFWELQPSALQTDGTDSEKVNGWVPLVMTGASQPWFAPIFLTLNWKNAGRELRTFVLKHGSESRLIQAREFYFRPGFSWTLRAVRLYPYGVPSGCIFTGSRPMAFPSAELGTRAVLGIFASRSASSFIRWYAEKFAWPKFAEGHLKNVPIPTLDKQIRAELEDAVDHGVSRARGAYRYYEPFLEFVVPRTQIEVTTEQTLGFDPAALLPRAVESRLATAYGLSTEEVTTLHSDLDEALTFAGWSSQEDEDKSDEDSSDDAIVLTDSPVERAWRLVSYCVGCLFGRWDVRLATGAKQQPSEAPVDAPLPSSPRGALLGPYGEFPTSAVPDDYPVKVAVGGILVHDDGHHEDISRGVPEILALIGVDHTKLLRLIDPHCDKYDASVWRTFAQVHIKMYSLGRRKAPIYWQLAIPSASYSVWLYIHALTKDTLYKVQNDYVVPKLAHEELKLESLRRELRDSSKSAERKALAAQESFVDELRAFLEEVKRVAPLWNPDLDDGVIINFAPLWRLVPHHKPWQKELKATWDTLCAGDYDWAHLAMHLWPERVIPKCATDRSLAIAHGLEEEFWVEGADGKWTPRAEPTPPVDELVRERSSPAVKSALASLLDAPTAAGSGRARGRRAAAPAGTEGGSR